MNNEEIKQFKLTVTTGDTGSENFVLDGKFNRVGSDVGRENVFNLPPGLYTVKIKVGSEFQEKPVTLLKDEVVNFEPVNFITPIPLQNTTETSNIAELYSKKENADVVLGKGSKLFLFGSINDSLVDLERLHQKSDPAIGLTLRNNQNKILIDFGRPEIGTYNWEGKPWAACDVDIKPGVYTLCLKTALGDVFKQNIVTSSGWQTQIFLQPKNYGLKEIDIRADLNNSAIAMSRIGEGFSSESIPGNRNENDFRLTEQIRQALVNKRNVIGKELLRTLFSSKFQNPMLGIYAAHLLLLNNDFIFSELKDVVTHLRSMLGPSHPDVEAIALKLGMESDYVFKYFPMLANSWNFILEKSVSQKDLVPVKSVAYRSSGQFWNTDLWLVWGRNDTKEKSNRLINFKNFIQSEEILNTQHEIFGILSSVVKTIASNKRIKTTILDHLPKYKSALDNALESLTNDKIISIAQNFGIPGNKVTDVLKNINLSNLTNAVKSFNIQSSPDTSNDPQKNKWGGKPETDDRIMSAKVIPSSIAGLYVVTITIKSKKSSSPLIGTVKFYLHNSFLNPEPVVEVKNGKAVLELAGVWGSFTVGAEADDGKTQLELDLSKIPGISKEFKER